MLQAVRIRTLFACGLVVCSLMLSGCGKETLDTSYVEGVITLDGEPVEGAKVFFSPVDPNAGISATGTTDENGKYTLTANDATAEHGAGTVPAEYYVMVEKSEVVGEAVSREEAEDAGESFEESGLSQDTEIKHHLPERYADPVDSGLKYKVTEGENLDADFDLSS
jgi:hypothetical protein